ncbi:glutamate 5-kinase [bacterium]|nr:glutamate 5-kinase [bacterium]MBT6831925.1 glutamate 5-kinase [bacterium]MBT6996621.1 glutamate 5-kinase [bacterium]MBT7773041.1 glutamate 5-kinase [bacterium]
MMKPIVVVKVGTAAVTDEHGDPNVLVLQEFCRQLAQLHKKYRLILVSSGAVGYGKKFLKEFSRTIIERRAAASIGNTILVQKYVKWFEPYGVNVSQALLERHHFSDRRSFLHLRETFGKLWENNFIPIVNENDVVSDLKLKFSDNDELATLIAAGFSAQKLLFGSSVGGVLDHDEKLIPVIEEFTPEIFGVAKGSSNFGLGGMISKLHCAKRTTRLGTEVVIFDARKPGELLSAEAGKSGTRCPARACDISAHQKWIASGSLISGKIFIDAGAAKALQDRNSLLAVGVTAMSDGEFEKGEVVEIFTDENEPLFAVARAKISSAELRKSLREEGVVVAHADEIVVM